MKSYILIWICLLFYCVAQDATEGNVDLAELKTLGDKALAENKFDDAIKYYTSAIKIDPEDVTFNYKRAAAYLLKGKNFNALEDLNIVLQNKPSFIQARIRRGKVFVALGKFSLAKQDFREVLEDKPDNDIAIKQLALITKCEGLLESGQLAFDQGKYNEALPLFNAFLDEVPESVHVRILRAKCNLASKQYNLVIEDTMKVLKTMSNHIDALFLRGRAFYYLGQVDAAINHYREALRFDPDNSQVKEEYKTIKLLDKNMKEGETFMQTTKYSEALNELISAINIENKNQNTFFLPRLYTLQCECYLKLKQPKLAIESCTNALQLESTIDALCNRAEAHIQLEDYEAAMSDYQQAHQKEQGNHRAREGLHRTQRLQKMAQRKDYYKILGVAKDATASEIKKAYRKLALEYHPDKHEDQAYAEAKMQEINEAVEVLHDDEKRRRYDSGEDLQEMSQPGGFHHQGFPFGSPFGGGGGGFHFNFNFG